MTSPYHSAPVLDTPEAVEEYLAETRESGDPALIAYALKVAACAVAALSLAGCVSLPKFHIPASAAPAPAAAPAKPVCAGNLLADLEPEPQLPVGAGFPAPQTEAESAAVALYGQWLHSWAVWGRHGWARAGDARDYCNTAH